MTHARVRSIPPSVRILLGGLVVVLAALLLVPDLLGVDGVFPVVGFVAVRGPLTVAVGVAALLALVLRPRWWPTVLALLLVVGLSAAALLPRVVADPAPDAAGPGLLVLTLNVDLGGADLDAVAATIRDRRPDLVVLPESGEPFRGRLAERLVDTDYRSWSSTPAGQLDAAGTTILAAGSLGDVRTSAVDGPTRFPWLELHGGALGSTRVVGVHVVPPLPGFDERTGELALLARWCADGAGPAVVVGDMNATLDLAAFRASTAGCTDAGAAAGAGLVATWPTAFPRWLGAQIDHVLVGGGVTVSGFELVEVPDTDHRGVLTTVFLPSGDGYL